MTNPETRSYLAEVRRRSNAATNGRSYINMLQSNGCELSLYDKTYTVWLTARDKNFRQTERDAEFITESRTDVPRLLSMLEAALAALEDIASTSDKEIINRACIRGIGRMALVQIERIAGGGE